MLITRSVFLQPLHHWYNFKPRYAGHTSFLVHYISGNLQYRYDNVSGTSSLIHCRYADLEIARGHADGLVVLGTWFEVEKASFISKNNRWAVGWWAVDGLCGRAIA